MIRHETLKPPLHIYPVNEWKIIETAFYPSVLGQTETIFSIGNGYLGMRGNFEEGTPVFQSGTYINGFHETWPITYSEGAYGFAKTGQTMLNVTDARTIKLYVDDEPFFLPTATLMLYERILDMQAGILERKVLWETPSGKQVLIESRRLVSLQHRHLAAISYQVTILNARAPMVISSKLQGNQVNQSGAEDPRQARGFREKVLQPQLQFGEGERALLAHRAQRSGMTLACGVDHQVNTQCPYQGQLDQFEDGSKVVYTVDALPGQPFQLSKFISYHSSRSAPVRELCDRAERTLDRANSEGFEQILAGQREFMEDFWRRSDVIIQADPELTKRPPGELQQAMRWNLFQVLQASGRAEGTGIPAKGLSGQTYEGHYFWDTEIYLLPFLTYSAPRIARNLLKFRHSMLDLARERANQVNQKGALFPWRTINGEEASAYYAAGTAQYHINADIMFALKKYVEITDDKSLLYDEGAEMLVETARLWADLGFYSERNSGQFCIHGVTGPDEYTTVVNNNTYTNLMARENLWFAVRTVRDMAEHYPDFFQDLVHKTNLDLAEVDEWQRAADLMYLPHDQGTGILAQDDNFLDREIWDLHATPRDKFPLLLHYHPLVVYRHQVIKQADVVLALFLLGDEFSLEEKSRNFDYYDPLTTGDSSLSCCIQSIVAAEVGNMSKAMAYGRHAMLMDLGDIGGNMKDGCHIASMGGTWMVAVFGFAGMRDYDGQLSFRPRLPTGIMEVRFPLSVRGQQMEVSINVETTTYRLLSGKKLDIRHFGQTLAVCPDAPVTVYNDPESELPEVDSAN